MSNAGAPVEPVRATWKVSEVLRRYPQLLEVLIEVSPHFGLLRNPVLRRIQPRLVTVAQAARIGGLEPEALVRKLNAALGLETPAEPAAPPPAAAAAEAGGFDIEHAPVAVELDVRPYHARGEEPFRAIMSAAAQVPVGQVLRLRNTFEPLPLYTVLGKRGFVHRTRQLGPDDWEVLFLNTGAPSSQPGDRATPPAASPPSRPVAPTAEAGPARQPTATLTIDVADLVPPEPMVRILEAMEQLPPGGTLLVHHVRRPVYLYPRLDALGYTHETRELGPEKVEILIHKPVASQQ